LTTGSNNTAVGYGADVPSATATNVTAIGYNAIGVVDNSVTLGNDSVTAVYMGEDSGATVYAGALNLGGTAVTATAAEINYSSGVTSNIQTQLDAKGTSSVDELKELDDVNIANNTMLIGNTADNMVTDGDNKAASNIGIGRTALDALTNADYNVAIGQNAAQSITTGSQNIAIGFNALNKSVAAVYNIAIGNKVFLPSATGNDQLAIGCCAGRWIVGDSSFNVCLAGSAVIMTSGTTRCVIAPKFCGDGSCLTGIGTQNNLGAFDISPIILLLLIWFIEMCMKLY